MHIPQAEEEKAKKNNNKNELHIIWFCYLSENYIIKLFINFKINFILYYYIQMSNKLFLFYTFQIR